ncbi:MAG: hypothetical protein HY685_01395 [Chloroflexi bacterium]|nr:hypothetical protein [Chloroflexota bacterium]
MRLGRDCVDGLYNEENYRREKKALEKRLVSLVVPGVDAAKEAGRLLENLPRLWETADLSEWRKLLLTILDVVYVDVLEEKRVVAIRAKPAFRALFEIATTRAGSGVVLVKGEAPLVQAAEPPCLWWRRGDTASTTNTRSTLCYWQLRSPGALAPQQDTHPASS